MKVTVTLDYVDKDSERDVLSFEMEMGRVPTIGEILMFENHPEISGDLGMCVIGVNESWYLDRDAADNLVSAARTEIEAEAALTAAGPTPVEQLIDTLQLHGAVILPVKEKEK